MKKNLNFRMQDRISIEIKLSSFQNLTVKINKNILHQVTKKASIIKYYKKHFNNKIWFL